MLCKPVIMVKRNAFLLFISLLMVGSPTIAQDSLLLLRSDGINIPGLKVAGLHYTKWKAFNKMGLSQNAGVPDTPVKKRFGRAAGGLMLGEMTPLLVDRYIRNMDYARISFRTVGKNLSPGSWSWDGDGFTTNQFGHPYHGSLFFNAFRVNGYGFWQSSYAVFAGSYLWETFAENQAPAPNDFINTGFGGIIMGEMTYRLSNMIVNNRRRGFRRQASEVLAFIINPMNGISRVADGKWGKITANSVQRDSSKMYTEFDIGLRKYRFNNGNGNFGLYAHLKFLYGSPYENYKTPFSNIYINTEFGRDDSSLINMVNIHGSVMGWPLSSRQKYQHLLLLTANYDYIRNQAFFYSGQSMKLNLHSTFNLSPKLKINTTAGASLVLLASVPNPRLYKGRYYDYCSGVGFSGSGTIGFANHFFYSINYRGGWLKTINGNSSHYFLHTITSELRYSFLDGFSLCAEPGYFSLQGYYKQYGEITNVYPYLRVSARYSFNIK